MQLRVWLQLHCELGAFPAAMEAERCPCRRGQGAAGTAWGRRPPFGICREITCCHIRHLAVRLDHKQILCLKQGFDNQ